MKKIIVLGLCISMLGNVLGQTSRENNKAHNQVLIASIVLTTATIVGDVKLPNEQGMIIPKVVCTFATSAFTIDCLSKFIKRRKARRASKKR